MNFVKVIDPESGRTVEIPETELAPGMVKVAIAGTGESYFKDANAIKPGTPDRTPLPDWFPSLATKVLEALGSVGKSKFPTETWITGFSADAHPVCELAIWMGIAATLSEMTHGLKDSIPVQTDIFHAILEVANNGFSSALQTYNPARISKARARSVMERARDASAEELVAFWFERVDERTLELFVEEWKRQQADKKSL